MIKMTMYSFETYGVSKTFKNQAAANDFVDFEIKRLTKEGWEVELSGVRGLKYGGYEGFVDVYKDYTNELEPELPFDDETD